MPGQADFMLRAQTSNLNGLTVPACYYFKDSAPGSTGKQEKNTGRCAVANADKLKDCYYCTSDCVPSVQTDYGSAGFTTQTCATQTPND